MGRVKPISNDDRLSLVDHLDELRARVVVAAAAFGVALALCFWQNQLLLDLARAPLPADHDQFLTLGVTEPFTTTLTVAGYGAALLSLPVILYQAYGYLLPAFSKQTRKTIVPLLLLIPVLFVTGAAFGYFIVMPTATQFLLSFNEAQFNIQLQAREYFGFFSMTLIATGLVFQVPVGVLGVTRVGIVSVDQLKRNRRFAYLGCAVVAAALPGVDPVTMLLETAPLLALYELSIVLAKAFGEPADSGIGDAATQSS